MKPLSLHGLTSDVAVEVQTLAQAAKERVCLQLHQHGCYRPYPGGAIARSDDAHCDP